MLQKVDLIVKGKRKKNKRCFFPFFLVFVIIERKKRKLDWGNLLTNIFVSSLNAVKALKEAGIPCRAILDSAVGYIVDKVDMVFVGAEGVVENGGVINQVR